MTTCLSLAHHLNKDNGIVGHTACELYYAKLNFLTLG